MSDNSPGCKRWKSEQNPSAFKLVGLTGNLRGWISKGFSYIFADVSSSAIKPNHQPELSSHNRRLDHEVGADRPLAWKNVGPGDQSKYQKPLSETTWRSIFSGFSNTHGRCAKCKAFTVFGSARISYPPSLGKKVSTSRIHTGACQLTVLLLLGM